MEASGVKRCPECRLELQEGHKSGLTTWQCPSSHGVGINLIEAYGHLQRDELEAIWGQSQGAPSSHLPSPVSGKPMVEVTFHVDEESSFERSDGGRDMTIEVDVENYFGWFQFEELRAMPVDTARRPMGATGVVGISQVDKEADEYEDFFENLEPEDFVEEEEQEEPEGGLNGFLGGLARRLRS